MTASSLSQRGLRATQYAGTATATQRLKLESGGRDLISLAVAQNSLMDDLLVPVGEAHAVEATRGVQRGPGSFPLDLNCPWGARGCRGVS